MNLIDDHLVTRTRRKPPVWLSVIALLIIAVFFPRPERRALTENRPLGVEEREAVIELFSALTDRVPELAGWTEETREVFEEDSLPTLVDTRPRAAGLARYENETLYFTPRFFEADSAAQENALLQAVVAINQPERPREDAIAVSGGD